MLDIREVELSENAKAVLSDPDVKILSTKFNELRYSYEREVDREISEAKRKMDHVKNLLEKHHVSKNCKKHLCVDKKAVKKYISDKVIRDALISTTGLFKIYKALFTNVVCTDVNLLREVGKIVNEAVYASDEEKEIIKKELCFVTGLYEHIEDDMLRKMANELNDHYVEVYAEIKTILKPTKEIVVPDFVTRRDIIEDVNHKLFDLFSATISALPKELAKEETQTVFNNFIKEAEDYIESKNPTEIELKDINESFEKIKSIIEVIIGKC